MRVNLDLRRQRQENVVDGSVDGERILPLRPYRARLECQSLEVGHELVCWLARRLVSLSAHAGLAEPSAG